MSGSLTGLSVFYFLAFSTILIFHMDKNFLNQLLKLKYYFNNLFDCIYICIPPTKFLLLFAVYREITESFEFHDKKYDTC